jgi:hypothetical protein
LRCDGSGTLLRAAVLLTFSDIKKTVAAIDRSDRISASDAAATQDKPRRCYGKSTVGAAVRIVTGATATVAVETSAGGNLNFVPHLRQATDFPGGKSRLAKAVPHFGHVIAGIKRLAISSV